MTTKFPCLISPDVPTINGRLYSFDVLNKALDSFMETDRWVVLDSTELERIVGKVINYSLTESSLSFDVRLLDTPMGALVKGLVQADCLLIAMPVQTGIVDPITKMISDLKIDFITLISASTITK